MRLSTFITGNMEAILAQWEAFAATLPAARHMNSSGLRDHAEQILQAVAKDLSTAQTREEQRGKSMGHAPSLSDAAETAAQTHGLLRAQGGFEINQMASEYRALRASVLRLWIDACDPQPPHIEDMIRFNEAIDQALAESVAFFSEKVEQGRNLFLGMLGHDMRTPLQAIQLTALYLCELNAGAEVSEAASRLISSGSRMKSLLDDLIAFNRASLGVSIPIAPSEVDIAELFAEELEQLRCANPHCKLELEVTGTTRGTWDGISLQRVLGNLVVNAIKYGAGDAPIQIQVRGDAEDLRFEVRNSGRPIDAGEVERLFQPLQRGIGAGRATARDGSLGLGLYIAREIAKAHGGDLQARCENAQTVFAVRLPKWQGGSP